MGKRAMASLAGLAICAVPVLSLAMAYDETVGGTVIIEADAVSPLTLVVEPERRVVFANRSGRIVHLQFMMRNEGQHHLFQVPDSIWAVFHHPGRHPFEVHFLERGTPTLRGMIEVVEDPYGRSEPLVCSGITVQGACLER